MLTACGGPTALPAVLTILPNVMASMDNFTTLQKSLDGGKTDFWVANEDLLTLLRSAEVDQIVNGPDMESLSQELDLACVAVDPVMPLLLEMMQQDETTTKADADAGAAAESASASGVEGDIEVMPYLMENLAGEDGVLAAYSNCGGSLFTLIEVARSFLPHLKTGKGFDPIVAVAEPSFGNVVNSFDLTCFVEHPSMQPIVEQMLETK
jgi:hypothetical protein